MPAPILLIDDDRDHLELMAYLLRAFAHRPMSSDSVRERAVEAGFDGFISKPISPEAFVFELQRFVKTDLTWCPLPPAAGASPAPKERPAVPQPPSTILAVDDRP